MKILVCCKYIHDENEISVNTDRTLKMDTAPWVISPYDLNAIQAGMKLVASVGDSTVELLTVAGEVIENSKMRKAALSRGPGKLYAVRNDDCGDLFSTATLLKQAIEKIGDVDLVICGEGSGDMYTQQLGSMLGALMGVATLNTVNALSWEGGAIVAERSGRNRTERFRVTGPAVLSVTGDICLTHIPSMKDIMGAGKKPVEVWAASEFEVVRPAVTTDSVIAPERMERLQVMYKEADEGGLSEFAKAIRKHI